MKNYLKILSQQLSVPREPGNGEVERLAILQQNASRQRATYAKNKAQTTLMDEESLNSLLSSLRKNMQEAEAAHAAALCHWENKVSRQKSY